MLGNVSCADNAALAGLGRTTVRANASPRWKCAFGSFGARSAVARNFSRAAFGSHI